ncbi:ribonuclease H-like domain-containing protein [Tanacetum coccineum]
MQNCNMCRTSIDIKFKLGPDGDLVTDPTLYCGLVGALQYLTCTHPGLSYVVLQLHVSSTAKLMTYTNADWDGCPTTRQYTFGYCVYLGDRLLSWSANRRVTLSRSSVEEYHGVANVVVKTSWIQNL